MSLELPRQRAKGGAVLTGARIVTLGDQGTIEEGVVRISDGRIVCVGDCVWTEQDRVVNVSGKTIIPGFIDMHAHHHRDHTGVLPRRNWEAAVYLAYGVTTTLDNSQWSQNVFSAAELVEAGEMVGPRMFSTGDPMYNGDGSRQNDIQNYEDAENNVERLTSWGATAIKSYMQPRRDQRQWIAEISRERNLMVTGEGGSLFYNVGLILDGQTGWEHPLTYVPLYEDAAKFLRAHQDRLFDHLRGGRPLRVERGVLLAGDAELAGSQAAALASLADADTATPGAVPLRPETDYSFPLLAQGLADIIAEGGSGAIGAHGQHHGIGSHWEIWMAEAAMGPLGALDLASRQGAAYLGLEHELGTVEDGKLADLVVLDENPLEDIRATTAIHLVIKDGRIYDGNTLDEMWPDARPYGGYPWLNEDMYRTDDRPIRPPGGGR